MTVDKWDRRFMRLAAEARSWAKHPEGGGVGACIVSADRRLFSLGYSGLPRGLLDTEARLEDREYLDHHVVHAELNAILNAGRSVQGWTLYTTKAPCSHCCSAMIQAGIATVVSPPPDRSSRWYRSQLEGADALREAGVNVERLNEQDAGDVAVAVAEEGGA
jgi:dCMP deaminase